VPQALLITGLVVAFCATALAVALLLRLFEEAGSATLEPEPPPSSDEDAGPAAEQPLMYVARQQKS
jgi:multicomponent Na+:H+ antiporter subunit C